MHRSLSCIKPNAITLVKPVCAGFIGAVLLCLPFGAFGADLVDPPPELDLTSPSLDAPTSTPPPIKEDTGELPNDSFPTNSQPKELTPDSLPDPNSEIKPEDKPENNMDINEGAKSGGAEEDDGKDAEIAIEEVFPLDSTKQSLSATFGYFRNLNSAGASVYFAGAGFRYSVRLSNMLLLKRPNVQDSIQLEGGVFLYKVLNFSIANDAYMVLPVVGTIRYTISFGSGFGTYLYGGVLQNFVYYSAGSDLNVVSAFSGLLPAGGIGFLFNVGPNWEFRTDAGIDMVALGLMVKF